MLFNYLVVWATELYKSWFETMCPHFKVWLSVILVKQVIWPSQVSPTLHLNDFVSWLISRAKVYRKESPPEQPQKKRIRKKNIYIYEKPHNSILNGSSLTSIISIKSRLIDMWSEQFSQGQPCMQCSLYMKSKQ